jgi:hypothetical protein
VLVDVAAGLPAGVAAETGALGRLALWNRPLVHVLPQDADAPLASVVAEAQLLGVLAAGAPSPLAAALVADDLDAVRDHLRGLLPEASDSAIFGSDLTAVVAGTPSARVTALLDGCADRESSGGAITWRFGPATVRRALDAGTRTEELIGELVAVAERELPQPLTYLINDVGRRHGRLRLRPAMSLIRSEDEALLAEVAADRRLARLGLRPVASTVLACEVPLGEALERLREVGYFPVPDPDAADAAAAGGGSRTAEDRQTTSTPARTATTARRHTAPNETEPVDHGELARRLLSAKSVRPDGRADLRSSTFTRLAEKAAGLASWELDHLADAVERGGRVEIDYRSASGARTRRVICDPELVGRALYAWCELRQDERVFTVSRILAVAPAE